MPTQTALDWPEVPFLRMPFLIREMAGVLSPADLLVFTHLCSLYRRTQADRRVPVTLGDIARWLGATKVGGEQRRAAKESLLRLRSATFESRLRWPGKGGEERWLAWGLLDLAEMAEAGDRGGCVTLSEVVACLLDQDSVVLLDAQVMEQLLRRSPVAMRLWTYHEAESLDQPMRYKIFPAREGEPIPDRRMPAIADLLRFSNARRRNVVSAVRRACDVIQAEDPRYTLTVTGTRAPGMWLLTARRMAVIEGHATAVQTGDLSDAGRAPGVTQVGRPEGRGQGDLSDARPDSGPRSDGPESTLTGRATWMTLAEPIRRSLPSLDTVALTVADDERVEEIRKRRREIAHELLASGGLDADAQLVIVARWDDAA